MREDPLAEPRQSTGAQLPSGPSPSAAVHGKPGPSKEVPPPSSLPKESIGESVQALLLEHQLVPAPLPTHLRDRSKAELKREVKRLQNLRAAEFAARVSGPGQDSRLREGVRLATKIGTEQARLRELRRTSRYGSSPMVSGGTVMAVDDLIAVLEQLREEAAARMRQLRQRIREECDAHPEFGLLAEERVSAAVERAPEVRPASKGRVRRRVEELSRAEAGEQGVMEQRRSFLLDGAAHPVGASEPSDISAAVSAREVAQLLSSVDEIFSGAAGEVAEKGKQAPALVDEVSTGTGDGAERYRPLPADLGGDTLLADSAEIPQRDIDMNASEARASSGAALWRKVGDAADVVAAGGDAEIESGDCDGHSTAVIHSREDSDDPFGTGRPACRDKPASEPEKCVEEERRGNSDGTDSAAGSEGESRRADLQTLFNDC